MLGILLPQSPSNPPLLLFFFFWGRESCLSWLHKVMISPLTFMLIFQLWFWLFSLSTWIHILVEEHGLKMSLCSSFPLRKRFSPVHSHMRTHSHIEVPAFEWWKLQKGAYDIEPVRPVVIQAHFSPPLRPTGHVECWKSHRPPFSTGDSRNLQQVETSVFYHI